YRVDLQNNTVIKARGRVRDIEIELAGPRAPLALVDATGRVRPALLAIHNDVPQDTNARARNEGHARMRIGGIVVDLSAAIIVLVADSGCWVEVEVFWTTCWAPGPLEHAPAQPHPTSPSFPSADSTLFVGVAKLPAAARVAVAAGGGARRRRLGRL